jgi:hypothetical protein
VARAQVDEQAAAIVREKMGRVFNSGENARVVHFSTGLHSANLR